MVWGMACVLLEPLWGWQDHASEVMDQWHHLGNSEKCQFLSWSTSLGVGPSNLYSHVRTNFLDDLEVG